MYPVELFLMLKTLEIVVQMDIYDSTQTFKVIDIEKENVIKIKLSNNDITWLFLNAFKNIVLPEKSRNYWLLCIQ